MEIRCEEQQLYNVLYAYSIQNTWLFVFPNKIESSFTAAAATTEKLLAKT